MQTALFHKHRDRAARHSLQHPCHILDGDRLGRDFVIFGCLHRNFYRSSIQWNVSPTLQRRFANHLPTSVQYTSRITVRSGHFRRSQLDSFFRQDFIFLRTLWMGYQPGLYNLHEGGFVVRLKKETLQT